VSSPSSDLATFATTAEGLAIQLAALQAELVAIKAETTAKVASLEDAIVNLAHENALLKRKLYGNRTERGNTSELQLALGELLAGEAKLQKDLDDAVDKVKDAVDPDPRPAHGPRPVPKGRRDLSLSKLPRVVVEILDEACEASGCRRIDFEDSRQLMFRRGGFAVLVKRVAKYEVIKDGEATVETVPSPETLFPRALLHTSAIAHIITSKFALGVPHYRLEKDLADQSVSLDRGTMSRYVEHAGSTLGATIVHAMWQDALANAQVIGKRCVDPTLKAARAASIMRVPGSLPAARGPAHAAAAADVGPGTGRTDRSNYALVTAVGAVGSPSGGGTSKAEIGLASSSGLSRPRVARQYFGASSR
jgi:transposase